MNMEPLSPCNGTQKVQEQKIRFYSTVTRCSTTVNHHHMAITNHMKHGTYKIILAWPHFVGYRVIKTYFPKSYHTFTIEHAADTFKCVIYTRIAHC